MNPRIFTACGVVACILATSVSQADQYTITIVTGYNLIANELDHVDDLGQPDGNTLSHIMGGDATLGCWLMKYDNLAAQWFVARHTAGGWAPDLTLDPIEGAFLVNPNPQPFDLTFTGNPRIPVPVPMPIPPIGLYSCQDETIAVASYFDITQHAPAIHTSVGLWDPAVGAYQVYAYTIAGWIPSAPAVPRGYTAWFNAATAATPPVYLVPSFVREQSGGSLTLVWFKGTLQQSSDLATWTDVLDTYNQPVTSPYTASMESGCLYFRLRG